MKSIFQEFPVNDQEYQLLENSFGQLCNYEAWQLLKKNARNNHTDDYEDISQQLRMSMIQAGSYYKRQVYIERCFESAKEFATDRMLVFVLNQLEYLWHNRTRHGANRQKFGKYQEALLERLIQRSVPKEMRPDKAAALRIDTKFATYCKAITWNQQKSMGKRITREKSIRSGQVSLSEFDYMGATCE
jgi:hypothetical protein